MGIQIGKYKRPGIFLEEYDNSVISAPIVDGITNLVIGVSKKGPVNTPIRLTNTNDLESIFGQLDRGLERKGSFFHRTISKMLESSPVYAINLLLTDDTLDTIEYKSLSSSANVSNDIERVGPYRRFHDTTGFWKRDTESFINLTKSNTGYADRAFNLTNLSDRYATVFVFHTQVSGFDRTLIEWYGAAEKVPPYVSTNDWASDYMVDVVIVSGDWSDYQKLSIDPRWGAYFNTTGLRKEQIRNFANDRNVTTLAYYEGLSLIPYFRDANGTNIFIETTINRDTDKTGIFCAFNNDIVEADFYNGKIDLIGNTIAGENVSNINFLSYNETIIEEVSFTNKPLDLPGNVTALIGTYSNFTSNDHAFGTPTQTGVVENGNRTTYFAEDIVNGVTVATSASTYTSSTMSFTFTTDANIAYSVVGDNYIQIATGSTFNVSVNSNIYASSSATQSFISTFVLDTTGTIKVVNSLVSSTPPSVAPTDIVLGYATANVYKQNFVGATPTINSVYVDNSGYKNLVFGTDYTITSGSNGSITVTFLNTNNTAVTSNYAQYRRFKIFNRLVDLLDGPNKDKMTMLLNINMDKVSLSGMTISNIITSTTQNKAFDFNTGLDNSQLTDVLNGLLAFYTVDNELILGSAGLITKNTVADTSNSATASGVVAQYSDLYTKFYDGYINTGDFIYENKVPNTVIANGGYTITFLPGETPSYVSGLATGVTYSLIAGNDYISFEGSVDPMLITGDQIQIRGAISNTGTFTILSEVSKSLFGDTSSNTYYYQVNENTSYEVANNITQVNNTLDATKRYLKIYDDTTGIMTVNFMDSLLQSNNPFTITNNINTFYVQSADSNYKQTLDIVVPANYVEVPNKILVNGSRYTEVVVGDFLDAEYDSTILEIGEVARKLTRILSKKQYSGDSSLIEITCDSSIKKSFSGSSYQVTRYQKVENYANTYKGVTMTGFRVRQASLPDGTETKQSEILNLIAKGTPLFKAITNKESFDFRYLVDAFGNGLIERSKQQLVDICGDRLDAFGFINMPSMKDFKNSTSPSFVDSDGVLQAEYIANGADPQSSPAFLYSFGDGPGTTAVGYFLPYLTVDDNGRPLNMPPASHVATTYMKKQNSNVGGITPWTIAAGVTNGRITNISGLEMDFTPDDIDFLNGAQMNPIVFKRNRGNVIETENTAQTLYKSALSYIHVREVLIELERELSDMLLDFQWKFNTSDTRAEIKMRADVICETYVNKGGLYNYFNKMDEENNTSDIIDNQIGVLDTYVEPVKGMGIIVNNVTILRTGAIAAGGFL